MSHICNFRAIVVFYDTHKSILHLVRSKNFIRHQVPKTQNDKTFDKTGRDEGRTADCTGPLAYFLFKVRFEIFDLFDRNRKRRSNVKVTW